MASQRTKRQHFVPRTYLKHFSVNVKDNYYINFAPSETLEEGSIKSINIENIAFKKDFYTLSGDSVEQQMLIEDYYAKYLEGPYNRIYDLLTDETVDFISDDDRNLIISIIITMYFRTTKWISEHNKFMNDVLEKVFSMAEHLKKDYFLDGDTKIAIKGKTVDQISKEYQAKDKEHQTLTQLSVALKLIKTRSLTDQISVCKLMEDSCEFITSDHPVICTNKAASHVIPVDPNNIFGIPLDKKHKLYISPIDKECDKNKIERYQLSGSLCTSNSYMSNKHQAYNADRFILGEQSSLSRFISIRNLLEQPLSPDEDLKDLKVKYTHLMNLLK